MLVVKYVNRLASGVTHCVLVMVITGQRPKYKQMQEKVTSNYRLPMNKQTAHSFSSVHFFP